MRILAVDTGQKRIGFAVSSLGDMSLPLKTVELVRPDDALSAILKVAEESEAEMILIGLPLNMDGSTGEMALKAEALAKRVESASGLPVRLWDERLSTSTANKVMIEADLSRAKRKKLVDKLAAQVFLQSFLDSEGGELS